MKIQRIERANKAYRVIIEVESKKDEKSLKATLDYLVAKKNKPRYSKQGQVIMLPKLLRAVI